MLFRRRTIEGRRQACLERLEPRRVLATLAIDAGGVGSGSFVGDRFFTGGGTFNTGDSIDTAGVVDPAPAAVYQSERTGQGGSDFRYDVTGLLPGESYDLRLHFAEIFWTAANQRLFDVQINGTTVLDDYDVFVEAGGADRAVVEEFTAIADASGEIRLDFLTEVNNAKLSGLEVLGEFPPEPERPELLFIRGGDRTGGFLEAGNDSQRTEQLADLFNASTSGGNHGWAELRVTLEAAGFGITQLAEGSETVSGPADGIALDLASMSLDEYDAIVFGSNNAVYSDASVDALEAYVRGGGSALFISDANFGGDWADASDSDQQFLDRFGLVAHQDQGTYSLTRSNPADFLVPDHPIFTNVDRIDGEGVTPIRVENPAAFGVEATILARAEGNTRLNNGTGGNRQGSSRQAGPNDATVLVASAGAGKIAGHFDRNTFFNQNGAGTNINRFNNKQYALNLFGWLVGAFDPVPGDYDGNGAVEEADRTVWANAFGSVGANAADGNGDGVVDAADYTIWRDNLGRSAPAIDLSVPATAAVDAAITSYQPQQAVARHRSAVRQAVTPNSGIDEGVALLLGAELAYADSRSVVTSLPLDGPDQPDEEPDRDESLDFGLAATE